MSHMHSSSIFRPFGSTEQKNKTNKKKKNFGREKKREKCQLEERSKFERNSLFDHHTRKILKHEALSDDDE